MQPRWAPSGGIASFASELSESVAEALSQAEALTIDGEYGRAFELLQAAAAQPLTDDDLIAVGEHSLWVMRSANRHRGADPFLESLAGRAGDRRARGALYFLRGWGGPGMAEFDFLRKALADFQVARDDRGRALTMAALSWPTEAPTGDDYRMRMAKAGLDLAFDIGDDWIVSYCANRLAGTQFYAGDPGVYETYRLADERLLIGGSTASADLVALNRVSWASVAVARGEYALASRLLSDGVVTAHTPRFADLFASFAELVSLLTKGPKAVKIPEATEAGPIGLLVVAEVGLEVDRAPDAVALDGLIDELAFVPFLQWVARGVQARLRALRNEPAPARDLGPVMDHIAARGIRSGWEDAAMALAEIDGPCARERFEGLEAMWAETPRARAAHLFCRGLVRLEEDAFGSLVDAADLFQRLPEPVTAARALHHAARIAPDTTAGNALRRQALELLRSAGADRSAADVVRDRTLHRGEGREEVSESMRRATGGALTKREREVVDLAIAGLTATEIADQLTLSVWTVRHHLQNARRKLGGVQKRRLGETFRAS